MQSLGHTGPMRISDDRRLQHLREMLEKAGLSIPVPTGNWDSAPPASPTSNAGHELHPRSRMPEDCLVAAITEQPCGGEGPRAKGEPSDSEPLDESWRCTGAAFGDRAIDDVDWLLRARPSPSNPTGTAGRAPRGCKLGTARRGMVSPRAADAWRVACQPLS